MHAHTTHNTTLVYTQHIHYEYPPYPSYTPGTLLLLLLLLLQHARKVCVVPQFYRAKDSAGSYEFSEKSMVSTAVREVAEKRSAGSTPVMLLFPRWRLVTRYSPAT